MLSTLILVPKVTSKSTAKFSNIAVQLPTKNLQEAIKIEICIKLSYNPSSHTQMQ